MLQDSVTALTGNIDKAGGLMGGWSPLMEGGLDWMSGTGRWHSRADRHPEVLGLLPSHALIADITVPGDDRVRARSEAHTSELQSLMRKSYAVFCLKKNT